MEMIRLEGERLFLRPWQDTDGEAVVELFLRNREHWQEFEPLRDDAYFTLESRLQGIAHSQAGWKQGSSYEFGIFLKDSERLIGDIAVDEVRRDPFLHAFVGYSIDREQTGQGYATEALRLLTEFAFAQLRLHRLTAGVSPRNHGSIRVLEKLGYLREGLARENLRINGRWEDHYQYAMLQREWGK
jgi:ribosomal-protein-alanine N-acetyltransferase